MKEATENTEVTEESSKLQLGLIDDQGNAVVPSATLCSP